MRNRRADLAHLSHIPRCFLDARDVWHRAQPLDGGDIDVDASPSGDVIDDDRHPDGFGDRFVMLEETFGSGFVVVRSDGQDAVRAGAGHLLRGLDDLVRVVAAGPGENPHTPLRLSNHELDDPKLLCFCQGRRLTGRPAWYEKVNAGVDLPPRKPANTSLLQRTAAGKRSNQRRPATGECLSHDHPPFDSAPSAPRSWQALVAESNALSEHLPA